jgi:hypothetical protein
VIVKIAGVPAATALVEVDSDLTCTLESFTVALLEVVPTAAWTVAEPLWLIEPQLAVNDALELLAATVTLAGTVNTLDDEVTVTVVLAVTF